jgi:ABC-2 type transport system ATP-binding protein
MNEALPRLRLSGLSKVFPNSKRPALDNVTLDCEAGRILAVVGPNGSGKSTLFRIISGLLDPDNGTLSVSVFDRTSTALMPDSTLGFYPKLTVGQNFSYLVCSRAPELRRRGRAMAQEWLGQFNLADRIDDECQALSRGMLQRLGLAIATAAHARILLLDEPTNGLDIEETLRLFGVIRKLVDESNAIVAFSSHQPDAILGLADEAVFLVDGKIRSALSKSQLTALDSGAFVKRYLEVVKQARA